ncbi:MAG: hypothetical protein R6X02_06310, partial [Enhygromyxa sp.]
PAMDESDHVGDQLSHNPPARTFLGRRGLSLLTSLVSLALLGLGCRPAAEPEHAGAPTVPPSPSQAADEQLELRGAPKPEPEPKPKGSAGGWTSALESSACELVCADVYSCLLLDGEERAAASIELGCLDACVRAPGAFAACERPGSIAADECAALLGCARAAWPSEERPTTIVEAGRDGCGIACRALARCRGFPEDKAELCAAQCREVLDAGQQRMAAECGDFETCPAIESCVNALPGA